ncbi:alpha-glucosidase C-terminal domain-containing protein [Pasteurella multocida]
MIALRKKLPILTEGDYQDLAPEHPLLWCYQRQTLDEKLLVLANLSEVEQIFELPPAWCHKEVICLMNNYGDYRIENRQVTLMPYQAVYLHQ